MSQREIWHLTCFVFNASGGNMENKLTLTLKVIALTTAFILTACGAQKFNNEGKIDSSSREVISDNTATKNIPSANCNQISNTEFKAQLMYYKTVEGIANNLTRMKIPKILSQMSADGAVGMRFYKFKSAPNNEMYFDSEPLSFYFQKISTYATVGTEQSELNWKEVKKVISDNGLGQTTLQGFLNNYTLTINLKDTIGEYEGLQMVVFDANNNVIMNKAMLIPSFIANPETFKFNKDGSSRHEYLQGLHPFKSMLGQGWDDAHFVNEAAAFCF